MRTLIYKGLDIMKLTKDNTVSGQLTTAQMAQVATELKTYINPTHVAISTPMDTNADYTAAGVTTPSPRTATQYTLDWCDAIHNAGMGVLHRPAWCGIEGLFGFTIRSVGNSNLLDQGVSGSSGASSWVGKTLSYLISNATIFKDGDIFAPIPEGTNGMFNSTSQWIGNGGPGAAANYNQFFIDMHATNIIGASIIGKSLVLGDTTQNYSELNSGYITGNLITDSGYTVVDHYGVNHSTLEMYQNQDKLYSTNSNTLGKKIFHQEWSDYWDNALDWNSRVLYLKSMYETISRLNNEAKYQGFSYWGGWDDGSVEGIFHANATIYNTNGRGKVLAAYYRGGGIDRIPVADSTNVF